MLLGLGGAFEQDGGGWGQPCPSSDHLPPAHFRMRLCTSATESEVLRGKNVLRNALVAHLDGESCTLWGGCGAQPGRDSPRVATVPARMGEENFEGHAASLLGMPHILACMPRPGQLQPSTRGADDGSRGLGSGVGLQCRRQPGAGGSVSICALALDWSAGGGGTCKPPLILAGTTPVCEDIGRSLLTYGRRIPLAEWESRIAVTWAPGRGSGVLTWQTPRAGS